MSPCKTVISAIAFPSTTDALARTPPRTNDAGSVASAEIPLDAAVAVAEKHVHGKAVRAGRETQTNGGQVFGVTVHGVEASAGPGVFDVGVDVEKRSMIASIGSPADDDNHRDETDRYGPAQTERRRLRRRCRERRVPA